MCACACVLSARWWMASDCGAWSKSSRKFIQFRACTSSKQTGEYVLLCLPCNGACSLLPMAKLEAVKIRIVYRCKQTNFLLKILQVHWISYWKFTASKPQNSERPTATHYSFGMFLSIFEFSSSFCLEEWDILLNSQFQDEIRTIDNLSCWSFSDLCHRVYSKYFWSMGCVFCQGRARRTSGSLFLQPQYQLLLIDRRTILLWLLNYCGCLFWSKFCIEL